MSGRLKWKLKIIKKILLGKDKHIIYMTLSTKQLEQVIVYGGFEGDMPVLFSGIHPYVGLTAIKHAGECIDVIDLQLFKAQFEGEVEYQRQKNK